MQNLKTFNTEASQCTETQGQKKIYQSCITLEYRNVIFKSQLDKYYTTDNKTNFQGEDQKDILLEKLHLIYFLSANLQKLGETVFY